MVDKHNDTYDIQDANEKITLSYDYIKIAVAYLQRKGLSESDVSRKWL